ncbi:hypothetical protein GGS20DRAFT_340248 [Poronia punctata]|nr:hypothetical protein GGS20DRAFT_340248 [Poronia punctata]
MGIRGLRPALRQYGTPDSLSGETAVIDGPALVYRIIDGCIFQRQPADSFVCHPSYSTLGRLVIGWLDKLREHDVNMRKIYFDGYLPTSKWEVRLQRLLAQSKQMKGLVDSYPGGSSKTPQNVFLDVKPDFSLTQVHYEFKAPPKPPFLIPAVLEILRADDVWGPLVEVVPGEADMYCAQDVRLNGGIVLTSDSDLLITDVGLDGKVSFFDDITVTGQLPAPLTLTTDSFSLRVMNDHFDLNAVGGLPRVAFETQKSDIRFPEALAHVKTVELSGPQQSEFQTFLEEYTFRERLPKDHVARDILSDLDARISEFVVHSLLTDSSVDGIDDFRGPDSMAMFLPIMIENRARKSVWSMSTEMRRLAYGITQRFSHHKSPTVVEYRLLDASNPREGRRVDVPKSKEVLEQCRQLVDTFRQIREQVPDAEVHWLAFAIYEDILWSTTEQRIPLSVLLANVAGGSPIKGRYPWDMIHFASQVQASFYSLRMAKQFLHVAAHLCDTLPASMRELRDWLDPLPPIAEWPDIDDIARVLATAQDSGLITTVVEILGCPPIELPRNSLPGAKSKKRSKRKSSPNLPSAQAVDNKRPTPAYNRFAALDSLN